MQFVSEEAVYRYKKAINDEKLNIEPTNTISDNLDFLVGIIDILRFCYDTDGGNTKYKVIKSHLLNIDSLYDLSEEINELKDMEINISKVKMSIDKKV